MSHCDAFVILIIYIITNAEWYKHKNEAKAGSL